MGKLQNSIITLSGIKLVSWDVDGTLFSYKRLALELFLKAIRNSSWGNTFKNLREIFEFHRTVESQRLQNGSEVDSKKLIRFKHAQQREKDALKIALTSLLPRPNAVALIRKFAAQGIVQIALSDFECQYKLEALGLHKHFEKAYSCEELGYWKPSPIPFSKVQNDFGVGPEQHLHIGDRTSADGLACKRNGCKFLHVRNMMSNFAPPAQ
jgi:FMN phosphatase YigB (HAD superfamily)